MKALSPLTAAAVFASTLVSVAAADTRVITRHAPLVHAPVIHTPPVYMHMPVPRPIAVPVLVPRPLPFPGPLCLSCPSWDLEDPRVIYTPRVIMR